MELQKKTRSGGMGAAASSAMLKRHQQQYLQQCLEKAHRTYVDRELVQARLNMLLCTEEQFRWLATRDWLTTDSFRMGMVPTTKFIDVECYDLASKFANSVQMKIMQQSSSAAAAAAAAGAGGSGAAGGATSGDEQKGGAIADPLAIIFRMMAALDQDDEDDGTVRVPASFSCRSNNCSLVAARVACLPEVHRSRYPLLATFLRSQEPRAVAAVSDRLGSAVGQERAVAVRVEARERARAGTRANTAAVLAAGLEAATATPCVKNGSAAWRSTLRFAWTAESTRTLASPSSCANSKSSFRAVETRSVKRSDRVRCDA